MSTAQIERTGTDGGTAPDGIDVARVEAFALRVAQDTATASAAVLVYVGDRLGLWSALAVGPATSAQLAARTGCSERYVREWLAALTATGYLEVDGSGTVFRLPVEHAAVLADESSPAFGAGSFESVVAFHAAADRLTDAFRTGGGISWGEHHPALYRGVNRFFTPLYARSLVPEWLPALEGVLDKLERGADVLDVGCGHGTSVVLMAQAFPNSRFTGIDVHAGSIEAARSAADEAGVGDRVSFLVADATDIPGDRDYDLACFFDAFHHMGDPTAVAAAVRRHLAADGTLMLVEPLAGDALADNLHLVGLIYYASSALVCVPDALAQGAGDPLGGQAGPERLADVLTDAGYGEVRVAARADFNLVVEARP